MSDLERNAVVVVYQQAGLQMYAKPWAWKIIDRRDGKRLGGYAGYESYGDAENAAVKVLPEVLRFNADKTRASTEPWIEVWKHKGLWNWTVHIRPDHDAPKTFIAGDNGEHSLRGVFLQIANMLDDMEKLK